jgi:hypothetical protein
VRLERGLNWHRVLPTGRVCFFLCRVELSYFTPNAVSITNVGALIFVSNFW